VKPSLELLIDADLLNPEKKPNPPVMVMAVKILKLGTVKS